MGIAIVLYRIASVALSRRSFSLMNEAYIIQIHEWRRICDSSSWRLCLKMSHGVKPGALSARQVWLRSFLNGLKRV